MHQPAEVLEHLHLDGGIGSYLSHPGRGHGSLHNRLWRYWGSI